MSPSLSKPIYVDDDAGVARLTKTLRKQSAFALDCEANSMFAYRERLCLLQISTRSRDYLVDPLDGLDLTPLGAVLGDPCITKVLHGGEFDVLLLKREYPFEISGLFDTRVAAASLGMQAAGLAAVLDHWLGVTIDKKFQRSNWGARPLSEGQKDYARRDTHFLLDLAEELRHDLVEAGFPHIEEVAAECRRLELVTPEPKRDDPAEFTKIKGARALDARSRRALQQLYIARDRISRRQDKPPFKVLGNAHLMSIAEARPRSRTELKRIDGLPPRLAERHGGAIVDALAKARELGPMDRLPTSDAGDDERMLPGEKPVYEALRQWRKATSERRGTEAALIMSRGAMLQIARLNPAPRQLDDLRSVIEGWRIEAYGEAILDAIESAEPRRRRRRD